MFELYTYEYDVRTIIISSMLNIVETAY